MIPSSKKARAFALRSRRNTGMACTESSKTLAAGKARKAGALSPSIQRSATINRASCAKSRERREAGQAVTKCRWVAFTQRLESGRIVILFWWSPARERLLSRPNEPPRIDAAPKSCAARARGIHFRKLLALSAAAARAGAKRERGGKSHPGRRRGGSREADRGCAEAARGPGRGR